ncbi:hypothetical protein B0F90DRAFT_1670270 [Multifurca ochricompacta]|uniref:Uncharacterized protein n=1 Tax=Multifurca ochricompacta TaxID=376703 RepID=A0AAD4LYY8_9AGAM|nr:hypothetical protein B0F90DRAFT_1670270 [Multifurca ochricompacta]
MPITTRKANSKAHPGHIIINSQQKRRTARQVAEDKAKSKEEEATAREIEATQHRAVVNRIANIEDRIQLAELSVQKHAARPDLAPSTNYWDNLSLCDVLEEVEHGQEDGPADLASESEFQDGGSEDSSAQAQSYPPTVSPASFTDISQSQTSVQMPRRTKKKSSSVGQLRSEVAKARVVNSTVIGWIDECKRKELQESYYGQRDPKRSKIDSTGLHVDCERRIETLVPTSTGMKSAVMASGSNCASRGVIHEDNNTTSQASQNVEHGSQSTRTTAQLWAQNTTGKMPIPGVPEGGSIQDPFGANTHVEGTVREIWCLVYPDILLGPKEMQITLGVVDNILNNWRSDIGKAGYKAIMDIWDNDPSFELASSEECAIYAESALKGFRFVYQYPDVMGLRAAFCSDLIMKVYAKHLQRIEKSPVNYGPQIGALALVTVAVERGLTLFKDGVKGTGFIEEPWGRKVREWVSATERVDGDHWEKIIKQSQIHYQAIKGPTRVPFPLIELDW